VRQVWNTRCLEDYRIEECIHHHRQIRRRLLGINSRLGVLQRVSAREMKRKGGRTGLGIEWDIPTRNGQGDDDTRDSKEANFGPE
jgi:hypothetical protein